MWQITDNLFVGRYRDTVNLTLLQAHNIDAMLQLAERIEQPGIEVLYLDVEDGEPLPAEKLRQGVSAVIENLESRDLSGGGLPRPLNRAMIHLAFCYRGISDEKDLSGTRGGLR